MNNELAWWNRNRQLAPEMLVRELEAGLNLICDEPHAGRQRRSRAYGPMRSLLLRRTRYHLFYSIDDEREEVTVVAFRHASRRPLRER